MFMDEVLGRNTKSRIGGVVKGHWSAERMDSILLISTNHKMSLSSFVSLIERSLWGNVFVSHVSPQKTLLTTVSSAIGFIQTSEVSK